MRTAIVSDIHGNLEALQAVLKDIETQKCARVMCLGDVVGYGPNPCECLDIVSKLDGCVLGNHDYGALIDPEGFSLAGLPIEPTPEGYGRAPLPIAPTAEDWSGIGLPFRPTPTEPIWTALEMDATE